MVAKLEQSKKETNHKIKMLKQQHRRIAGNQEPSLDVLDLSEVPDESDRKTINDLRGELALMEEKFRSEEDRLARLLKGCGRGRGKSIT